MDTFPESSDDTKSRQDDPTVVVYNAAKEVAARVDHREDKLKLPVHAARASTNTVAAVVARVSPAASTMPDTESKRSVVMVRKHLPHMVP